MVERDSWYELDEVVERGSWDRLDGEDSGPDGVGPLRWIRWWEFGFRCTLG